MHRRYRSAAIFASLIFWAGALGAAPPTPSRSVLLTAMETELERTWKEVKRDPEAPLFFLGYTITESSGEAISAGNGVITQDDTNHGRTLDVSARVGTPELDSTHEIRGGGGVFGGGFGGASAIPLDN